MSKKLEGNVQEMQPSQKWILKRKAALFASELLVPCRQVYLWAVFTRTSQEALATELQQETLLGLHPPHSFYLLSKALKV